MSLHQHVAVISRLSASLGKTLQGAVCTQAVTYSKNELSLYFTLASGRPFSMQIVIAYGQAFYFFDNREYMPRANAQPVFTPLWNKTITGIEQHRFNRSFAIHTAAGQLVCTCYNALANVLYYPTGHTLPEALFRKEIKNDWQRELDSFHQSQPVSEVVLSHTGYYFEQGPHQTVIWVEGPTAHTLFHTTDIYDAFTFFSKRNSTAWRNYYQREAALRNVSKRIQELEKQVAYYRKQLSEWNQFLPPESIGHLLMAYLHAFKKGDTEVSLPRFENQEPVRIRLQKNLTPQQNAAHYYAKSKQRAQAHKHLEQTCAKAEAELVKQRSLLQTIQESAQWQAEKVSKTKVRSSEIPFKQFSVQGFEVWVGKHAANNDVLTLKYAHKNDLWLHAKDVAGSHVVVKHKAGKPFTKDVIEEAAAIAAYYSKLRGSTWVPVSYTLRKWVRKPKGMEPGQVIVDKEEVCLVAPSLPTQD